MSMFFISGAVNSCPISPGNKNASLRCYDLTVSLEANRLQ